MEIFKKTKWYAWGFMLLSCSAQAGLTGDNLPPVKNISAIFGAKPALTQAKTAQGIIGTLAKADDSARGTAAKEMAQMLAAEIDNYDQQAFINAVGEIRGNIEAALQQNKFALQDLGVAYALCTVMLWEIANDHTLPVEASAKVIQQLIGTFDQIGETYYQASATDKALLYDQLMATPMILLLMKEGYKQTNQADGVAEVQQAAATLFKNMTTLAHSDVLFSDSGEISGTSNPTATSTTSATPATPTSNTTVVGSAASSSGDW